MKPVYYISLNFISPVGLETFGKFNLGPDENIAKEIFGKLKGDDHISDITKLTMDLTEETAGIPLPIALIHCTLEELSVNTKTITKELFKLLHL
jgi:hypothetical protein